MGCKELEYSYSDRLCSQVMIVNHFLRLGLRELTFLDYLVGWHASRELDAKTHFLYCRHIFPCSCYRIMPLFSTH
jgi:hypothetical protein